MADASPEEFKRLFDEFIERLKPEGRERLMAPVPMYEITYLYANLRTLTAPTDEEKKVIDHLFPVIREWALGIKHRPF
jgi:hypothetical protein